MTNPHSHILTFQLSAAFVRYHSEPYFTWPSMDKRSTQSDCSVLWLACTSHCCAHDCQQVSSFVVASCDAHQHKPHTIRARYRSSCSHSNNFCVCIMATYRCSHAVHTQYTAIYTHTHTHIRTRKGVPICLASIRVSFSNATAVGRLVVSLHIHITFSISLCSISTHYQLSASFVVVEMWGEIVLSS